ncbi:hypothetical protein RIF29_40690 [Crotalaria pallida]|uniref:Uncharacterized protein n=1 Tax=Crotalaria pallida TaxID=3830 RepID=A0AAN9HUI9_CROPI
MVVEKCLAFCGDAFVIIRHCRLLVTPCLVVLHGSTFWEKPRYFLSISLLTLNFLYLSNLILLFPDFK